MGRAFRDLPPDEDEAAVLGALRTSEVEHMAFRNAQTLSGGEQARTTFARVVAQVTPIVLLDEPTAALDLRHQERVLATAKAMAKEGATVVAVLHDLNLAAAFADRVVLLSDGASPETARRGTCCNRSASKPFTARASGARLSRRPDDIEGSFP